MSRSENADASAHRAPAARPLDYLFVTRPTVAVGMWVFFLWGAASAALSSGGRFPLLWPPRDAATGLAAMTAVLAGGCLLNQIVDVDSDRVNRKLFFLPRGIISQRAARLEMVLLWILAAALATLLSPGFRLMLAVSLLLNVTYSAPPVSAKSRFPLDMLWNGAGFGLVSAAAGWASVAPLSAGALAPGIVYTLAVAGVTASTTVLDVEGDRAAGLRTTAAVLGSRGASALAIWLVSLAAIAGAFARDPLGLLGPILALPLMLKAHQSGRRSDRILANQFMVGAFALVASTRAPFLLALVALVYFGTRAYYRVRFGLTYPGVGTP